MAGQASRVTGYRERNSTADRALEILGLFTEDHLFISGGEVAAALGIARSTAYRYLQSLVAAGFLEERHGSGFQIGPRVLELARLARRGMGDLSGLALPAMRELREELSETVLLTRRMGDRVVCLEREEALAPVRISYERGSVLPLHAGASALVLLAWLAPSEARRLLEAAPLERFTDNTVTDVDTLMHRLAEIREQGFAITRGELDPAIAGIGMPVLDHSGEPVAGISVVALSRRLPDERIDEALAALRRAAASIERQLEVVAQH
jgi:DNA-binding IclR family transcriptional regulator